MDTNYTNLHERARINRVYPCLSIFRIKYRILKNSPLGEGRRVYVKDSIITIKLLFMLHPTCPLLAGVQGADWNSPSLQIPLYYGYEFPF